MPKAKQSVPVVVGFRLYLDPPKVSHHAKKRARWGGLYDTPELVAAKATLDLALKPFRPKTPLGGPITLRVDWTFPWRAGDGPRARQSGKMPCSTKPDLDNLAKTFIDALCRGGFMENDSRVVELQLSKHFGDAPGIEVEMRGWA